METKKTLKSTESALRALQFEKSNWQARQSNIELVLEEKRALESKLDHLTRTLDALPRLESENKQLKQNIMKWYHTTLSPVCVNGCVGM